LEINQFFSEIWKQIGFKTDIFRITLPSILLQPVSLLEKFSTLPTPVSILNGINNEKKEELKTLKIISWLLFNWKNTARKTFYLVKPYNPILGEIFKCHWINEDGSKTTYISEQVCHHPPISAFYSYNNQLNITFEGWCEPKINLSINSASSYPNGNFRIILHGENKDKDEIYSITKFPNLICNNIFYGQINIDIGGEFEISNKVLTSNINISKGNYEGYITKEKKKLFQIKGSFENGVSYNEHGSKNEFKKVENITRPKIQVEDINDQADNESRKVWLEVTKEIIKGNFDNADVKKKVIEDDQRKNKKEKFTPSNFVFDDEFGWTYKHKK